MKTRLNWMLWLLMLSVVAGLSSCKKKNNSNPDSDDALAKTTWSHTFTAEEFQGFDEDRDPMLPEGTTITISLNFIDKSMSKLKVDVNIPSMPTPLIMTGDVPYIYEGKTKKVDILMEKASNIVVQPNLLPGMEMDEPSSDDNLTGVVNWETEKMTLKRVDGSNIVYILSKVK